MIKDEGSEQEKPAVSRSTKEKTTDVAPRQEEAAEAVAAASIRPEREAKFQDYIRIFSYAKGVDYLLIVLAGFASIGAGVTMPLMNIVFGKLVGDFNGYFLPTPTETQAEFERSTDRNALYIFALFIARLGLSYINKLAFRMIGIRMSAAIRLDYLKCLFGQSIHVLDSMAPGAAAGSITTTANTLQIGISEKLAILLEFLTMSITAIIIAFVVNWLLTLVTGTIIIFILLATGIFLPSIVKGNAKQTAAETRSSAIASEAFSSIRMVVACGAEKQTANRFSVWVQAARLHGQRTSPFVAAQFGSIFFGLYSTFGLSFWYGTKMVRDGRIELTDVGDIVAVLTSMMILVISLERISTPLMAVSSAMVAACELFTVIDAPKLKQGELKAPDVSAAGDIKFKDVTFAYPARPHVKILDNLNLTIEAGKLTAIVGSSGSGKSTIVGLIERWYGLQREHAIAKAVDPGKKKGKKNEDDDQSDLDGASIADPEETGAPVELNGCIQISGHDLGDLDMTWWRTQIGLVSQEPFLFNTSIYQNVAYGLIGSEFENESEARKKELVIEACKEAFVDEFIDRLPDGYDTMVGDSGMKLSGGQRQRISIARAIIKKPKILILDEATSAIDVRGERIVQAALDKVSQGRTTITVAHRLSTIKKADRIVVVQKGCVVEEGTHQGLLENAEGVYYALVHAQQLSLGDPAEASESETSEEEDKTVILSREKSAAFSNNSAAEAGAREYKPRGLLNSFGRLLIEQNSRLPAYVLTIVFAMCTAAAPPMQAYLFGKIIVVFQATGAQFEQDANFWALMWVMLAIGAGLSYFILSFVANHLAHFISATYRQQYFESLLHQKTTFFDSTENSMGSLTSRVGGDPKQLEQLLGMNMAMVYNSCFTLIGSLAIGFAFGWKLTLVAMCVTAPISLVSGYYRLKFEMEFVKLYEAVFAESSQFAAEAIGAFRTVTSMTLENTITTRYAGLLDGHVRSAFIRGRWTTLALALSDSMSLGCQALIFWYGGHLLAIREMATLNFFVCYMAMIQGAEGAGGSFSFGPNAAQASAAANRILSVRESRADLGEKADADSRPIPDAEDGIQVEFRKAHFKYPTRDVPVFGGLDMTIEKGQFCAIVGASGSGKTSIISLLERFYDLQKGQILANGVDIASMNAYAYRRYLSLVAQEPNIFQGTLRENILLGVEDATTITEEDLHSACRDANIHDFIISLPSGYDTNVGSRGVSLSGGQKQRVAIARAMIRNPRLLLLDEATSSLDSTGEKQVQAAFERVAASRTRTMIVVAHRLATVQNADVIFVLGEGKVLEKGSHGELLRKKGLYWSMCQSQALDR